MRSNRGLRSGRLLGKRFFLLQGYRTKSRQMEAKMLCSRSVRARFEQNRRSWRSSHRKTGRSPDIPRVRTQARMLFEKHEVHDGEVIFSG